MYLDGLYPSRCWKQKMENRPANRQIEPQIQPRGIGNKVQKIAGVILKKGVSLSAGRWHMPLAASRSAVN